MPTQNVSPEQCAQALTEGLKKRPKPNAKECPECGRALTTRKQIEGKHCLRPSCVEQTIADYRLFGFQE